MNQKTDYNKINEIEKKIIDHNHDKYITSWSHHYPPLENALQNHFFPYFAWIMGTLKGSNGQFFNFSAESQNFTGVLNGPELP